MEASLKKEIFFLTKRLSDRYREIVDLAKEYFPVFCGLSFMLVVGIVGGLGNAYVAQLIFPRFLIHP